MIHPEDQQVLNDFSQSSPRLQRIHETITAFSREAIDAMPRPRFGMHDEHGAFPDQASFIDAFGIDTSHFYHPVRQWHVLRNMLAIDFPDISKTEQESLELTAIVHDIGEPYCEDGDARLNTKTNEKDETAWRHWVLRESLGDEAEEIIERTEPVMEKHGTNPGSYKFALSEQLGYTTTGARAARKYLWPAQRHPYNLTPAQREVAALIAIDVAYLDNLGVGPTGRSLESLREESLATDLLLTSVGGLVKTISGLRKVE